MNIFSNLYNTGLVPTFLIALGLLSCLAGDSPWIEASLFWVAMIYFAGFSILFFSNLILMFRGEMFIERFTIEKNNDALKLAMYEADNYLKIMLSLLAFYAGQIWLGSAVLLLTATIFVMNRELKKYNTSWYELR